MSVTRVIPSSRARFLALASVRSGGAMRKLELSTALSVTIRNMYYQLELHDKSRLRDKWGSASHNVR